MLSFEDLFAVNAAEKNERDEKAETVRLEKEYQEKLEPEKNKKVDLKKKPKEKVNLEKEETDKKDKESDNGDSCRENQDESNESDEIRTVRDANLWEADGKSETEKQNQEIDDKSVEETIVASDRISDSKDEKVIKNSDMVLFGESKHSQQEYLEEWEEYIRRVG